MKNNYLLLYLWALLLMSALMVSRINFDTVTCRYYEEKVEAAELTKKAFEEIKLYKSELAIELPENDINLTGLIGLRHTPITTTVGTLESKRTSTNPNFAAIIIEMMVEGGIKKGDEIVLVFSGSFPALNIATMAAVEIMQLKPYIMSSIGSSSYGANNVDFTFLHMAERLLDKEIFSNSVDLVSLGGANDIADEFDLEIKMELIDYISSLDVEFLYEGDFEKNIEYRLKQIKTKVPKYKMLINVGGNLVSLGQNEQSFYQKNGLIKGKNTFSLLTKTKDKGLIQRSLEKGIPVIQLLNIKSLAHKYQIPYDHKEEIIIGKGVAYLEKSNNIIIPIIAIVFSVSTAIFYKYFYKERENKRHA